MSRGIFITGTDTDVGKTFVSALMVKKLLEYGVNAGYYKAALSGAEYKNGDLTAGDAEYVKQTAGLTCEANSMVSYIYEPAVSPHLAAQLENRPIEIEKLVSDFCTMKKRFDFITVEGSGGIVCPLRMDDETIMLTDVIRAFNLDVVIVSTSGLGAINRAVLTVEYARSHSINVKGIIMNGYENGNFLHIDNKKQIEVLAGTQVITCIVKNASEITMDKPELIGLFKEFA